MAAGRWLIRSWKWLPVVERELRIAARGRALYRWRTVVVGLGLGLMALATLTLATEGTPFALSSRAMVVSPRPPRTYLRKMRRITASSFGGPGRSTTRSPAIAFC